MREKEKKSGPSFSSKGTPSRRALLDWLGKATVLGLGSELLAACAGPQNGDADTSFPDIGDPDGLATDDAYDATPDIGYDGSMADGDLDGWPFHPPDDEPPIYETWPVRTVDPQELAAILASWTLTVDGMVRRPLSLRFAELLELERQDQITDFHCVEGWSVLDVPWSGVHLSTLLALAEAHDEASHLTFHTIGTDYNESLPIDIALEPLTLLAYGVAGNTIPLRHGFPLRLVVPRLFAYKSAKFVQRIELTDSRVEGYWVQRGYPYLGEVPDSRLREGRF